MTREYLIPDGDVTNTEATNMLKLCGIERNVAAHFITGPLSIPATAALFLIFCWFIVSVVDKEITTALVMLFMGFIGVWQWRMAKTEAALDKFYDRLNLTNERLRFWRKARTFISEQWDEKDTFEMEMYACLEVDNLEYVIQKYERGYMEPRDALREFTCFSSRCHEGKFRDTAITVAKRGGYKGNTMRALYRICRICPQNVCPNSRTV